MNRRTFTLLVLLAVLPTARLAGKDKPISPGGLDLKNTLEKGLKCRRPVEFQFVAEVVARVHEGTLPIGMVESTFLYARRKKPYPFPYFQFALRTRAKKLGIVL